MAKEGSIPKKTETLTLRLDPKTKYAIELLARSQKRTLAGAIEWAVERSLSSQMVDTVHGEQPLKTVVDETWYPDDLVGVATLGAHAPHLLNHHESCLWAVIKNTPVLYTELRDAQGKLIYMHQWAQGIIIARDLILEAGIVLSATGELEPIPAKKILELAGEDESFLTKILEEARQAVVPHGAK
ncbi:hypothetical protein CXG45_27180 [Pseudomonas plecoglossicida]|uniref:CopG family transcriptional regulator n=1 Tax=Pseudomonas plecoglossicida TaxID=70775 RepID=A0ABX4TU70_PSEDL|nr:hypothetical protein [Pseudomonas plecoglossicida]PLU84305.1 hypothetical protein CXG44_26825 [Pseudomonas plecoglossicida]PLU89569.1 hypothetical protein CXG45_27180 [Pseudomonas plecoglossicida]PLU97633.1 hypothetical protein CXG48_27150 [Pseudomonas plecoglossicida]PLV07544.1 hypothetical protein CXG47_27325 [Pseudomonas plecoglossicida]